ncbi:MAG: HemK2/MTQ2 family protein methyltransferase [Promethearchaeota archaeon]
MININDLPDPIINYDFEKVYIPSDDSYLIIDYFKKNISYNYFDGRNIKEIKRILDIGTGTGIIAIFFQIIKTFNSNFNPEIYASDISEDAIKCAKSNEKANNFENEIIYIQSDLFKSFPDNLKNSFDIIVFNPPYLPSSELINDSINKAKIDYSWDGGKKGYEITIRFLENLNKFIKKTSYIYYISSSRSDLNKLVNYLVEKGFKTQILEKKHTFFEDIILNRLEIGNV